MSEAAPPKPPPRRRLASSGASSGASRGAEAGSTPRGASQGPPGTTSEARPLPAPNALPTSISEQQKQAIAVEALGLLNEQLQARIVHYKAELETSPELDAITAQVVAQLKEMQASIAPERAIRKSPEELEAQQVRTLSGLLGRVFAKQSNFVTQIIKPVGHRVAKLFFESELHQKTKGDKDKTIFHAEQGVYYVLQRYSHRLRAELEGFEYTNEEIKELTLSTLARIERDLQVAFLSRRSPELNRVMMIFTTVLTQFLQEHLPPRIDQLAKVAIRAAETARRPNSVGYKVVVDAFPQFRSEWERLLTQQMVHYCGDELLAQLTSADAGLREETIKFFTDPHVFSETLRVLCDNLYDFLCLEGFLDLPIDWRVQLARD